MKKTIIILGLATTLSISSAFAMNMDGKQHMMGKGNMSKMVNNMPKGMQMKLKYDYLVNLPILMRSTMQNADKIGLSKEQKMSIKQHKNEVMDSIVPVMKKSHMLSKKLKDGLLYGEIPQKEAVKLASEIAELKKKVLNMKIVCISFVKSTLSSEQFKKLIELDKKMPYLNSPYNY